MLIQRQFNEAGRCSHVLIKHTGLKPAQNFSHRLVERGLEEGWLRLETDTLTLVADPEDLRYSLTRRPGYYCLSTGERMPISDIAWGQLRATGSGGLARAEALAWLAANGKAAGDYEVTQAYECVLDAEQHARFKLTTGK